MRIDEKAGRGRSAESVIANTKASYGGLAEIYDSTIEVDYRQWTEFLVTYFAEKGIALKGKRLLELGCGTGNMTLLLKEQGMEITAVDLSQEMLQSAMEKAIRKRYKILFINQNMVKFEMNKKYDYIFSFCDAYNYITQEKDLEQSLKRVYEHLSPNGCFVFDISTAYKLSEKIGNKTFTMNEEELCYIWDNYYDDTEEILEMYITFFAREGKQYKRFQEQHVQKLWKNAFLLQKLKELGFRDIEIHDDYTNRTVENTSLRAVFLCWK